MLWLRVSGRSDASYHLELRWRSCPNPVDQLFRLGSGVLSEGTSPFLDYFGLRLGCALWIRAHVASEGRRLKGALASDSEQTLGCVTWLPSACTLELYNGEIRVQRSW